MAKANKKSNKKVSGEGIYYYSNNLKKDSILIKNIVTALEEDYKPHHYIRFVTTNGFKFQWEYTSEELRNKEIKEIRELRDSLK